jgi:hypothetical protein
MWVIVREPPTVAGPRHGLLDGEGGPPDMDPPDMEGWR